LIIRNWRPGDRFWPAHTKEAKKVKELLNDHHIVGPPKERWPVAVAEGFGLVWMRGFAAPASFKPPGLDRCCGLGKPRHDNSQPDRLSANRQVASAVTIPRSGRHFINL